LITNAKVHDVNILDELNYENGSYYIMDRGYVDFSRLHKIHRSEAYFVTRAKDNTGFRRMYSNVINKSTGIRCDQIGKLETVQSSKAYPDKLRRVKYYDKDLKRELAFLTNNMELKAMEISFPSFVSTGTLRVWKYLLSQQTIIMAPIMPQNISLNMGIRQLPAYKAYSILPLTD
jgi:hypothetical protein